MIEHTILSVVNATCTVNYGVVCLNDYENSVIELCISLAVVFYMGTHFDTVKNAIPNTNQLWIMEPMGKGILKLKKIVRVRSTKKKVDVGRFKDKRTYIVDTEYTMFHVGFANQNVIPIIENNVVPAEHSFEGTKPIMEVVMKGDKDTKQEATAKDDKGEALSIKVKFTLPIILMADRVYTFFKDDYVKKSFAAIFESKSLSFGAITVVIMLLVLGGGYLLGNNFPYQTHAQQVVTTTVTSLHTGTLSTTTLVNGTVTTYTNQYCFTLRNGTQICQTATITTTIGGG